MTRPDDTARIRVPDLYLERYRLGELPEDERGRIERLLELDPELRGRLDGLGSSDAEIARRLPAPLMDERIRGRARAAGTSRSEAQPARRGRVWLAPALAAAAVVLAVGVGVMRPPAPDDGILLKGSAAELVVYRKTAAGSERLEPGAAAAPGDLIRVGYRAAGQGYGAIVSTDGYGNVTQHLPRSGGRAVALEAGGTVLLDFSYELDDAPRWERFYLVTSDEPFELKPVRRAAQAVAGVGSEAVPPPLELTGGLDQSVFTLAKESVS
jgi:hypothetical protein